MRKKSAIKRKVLPDSVYNSIIITKLINKIMISGKKGKAQKILYRCFDLIEKQTKQEPLSVFMQAFKNVSPLLELKVRKIGGANYQVPVEVYESRKIVLALRWIVKFSMQQNKKSMEENLSAEILEAYNNTGKSVKKKEEVHKQAEANKAFAHYRW